ncbi:MAG: hypothetical protein HC919_01535 [Oscillatoriales cyanobacterium SM2_2_1]|nr:hypothetical protein [Oscillatoriales cyanobacterium SM2_2_1]
MALATLVLLALLVGLLRRWSGRIWLLGAGAIAAVLIFSNARLVNLLTTLSSGTAWTQGELFFRAVTASGGWQMGLQQPLTGLGLGSVVQLFQEYRPVWGGRQAEHVFQLHSTPVQVWAELGILGCGAMVLALLWVVATLVRLHFSPQWRSHREHQTLTYGLGGGLLAYFVMALTDTQLDVLAIAGFLLIALASLSHLGHLYLADSPLGQFLPPWRRGLAVLLTAFTIAAVIYETPVLAAWQQSSLGFVFLDQARTALREQDLSTFQEKLQQFRDRLTQAQALNPVEPYYPFQLGWNLGDLAMALTLGGQSQTALPLRAEAIAQIEHGIALNPHLEFGHSTVGWLYLQTNQPAAAEPHFRRAIALIPTKRSLHFGLADALLRQQKIPDGIQALADEIINEPIFLTSPLLNSFPWQIYRDRLFTVTDERYTELIKAYPAPELQAAQAFLRWWSGRQPLASPANPSFIAALQGQPPTRPPQSLSELAIAAFYNPKEREFLLTRAYALSRRRLPDELDRPLLQALLTQMNQAKDFDRWVRSPIPLTSPLNLRYQRERTAFGLLSRNIDGPAPADLYFVHEHALFSLFFSDLFPLTPATPFMNNRGL